MKRAFCGAMLLAAASMMVAGIAVAAVPSGGNSTSATIIPLGGHTPAFIPDPKCEKIFVIRDAANNPVPNSVVTIDFSGCSSGQGGIHLALPTFAGLVLNCGARTVSGVTNAAGIVAFRIAGASAMFNGTEPYPLEGCAVVTADGIVIGNLSVATPDFNGDNGSQFTPGVDAIDTALFVIARYALYRSNANFIGPPGTIDGQDTVVYAGFRFGMGSVTNGPFCP